MSPAPECVRSLLLAALICVTAAEVNLATLDDLYEAIQTGDNKKVAFLTLANYDAVRTVLPSNVEPIFCDTSVKSGVGAGCDSTDEMIGLITSGQVVGGLKFSGLPSARHARNLNIFSSTIVSTRAMLMAPVHSAEMPHGTTDATKASYDLSKAVDASIVTMQAQGLDEKARQNNLPFEFMAVHTCKGSDLSAFTVPNGADATGLLRTVLDTRILKIGASGPYDWGGNDGNFKVTPYTGFYPDWVTEFCLQFNALKGADGISYNSSGAISCKRVWQWSSSSVFADLYDGVSHVTEPYYVVDGSYIGTGENCTSSPSVCRNALTASGKEICSTDKKCTHPKSPRMRHFRMSCSTFGVDSTFMTKKFSALDATSSTNDENDDVKIIAIVAAIVCGLGVVCLGLFACVVVRREKSGKPMFMALAPTQGGEAGQSATYGVTA